MAVYLVSLPDRDVKSFKAELLMRCVKEKVRAKFKVRLQESMAWPWHLECDRQVADLARRMKDIRLRCL
ncbi:MAG: hypothetical protein KGL39_42950, partial [Patescibacteria group bacterium]|nr:hypothetical protein [Patescibacteria group bacterium]